MKNISLLWNHINIYLLIYFRVDSREILRKDWMFKLVGTESFELGKNKQHKCCVRIDPIGGFAYQYSLEINGKPYKKFLEQQTKVRTS